MNSCHEQRQRIILVTELFYPEETSTAHIVTKIANKLLCDFDMLIFTGPISYEGRINLNSTKPTVNETNIERLQIFAPSKNSLLGRIFRFLLLTIGLGWKILLRSRRTDIVFAVSNPAPLLVALAMVRVLRRFRLVFLVHDVFPENAVAAGIVSSDNLFYSLVKRVFNWAYASANAVITIGRDMSEVLAKKIPTRAKRITLIENWADYPLAKQIPRDQSMIKFMGLSNQIVIQYAGNLGRAQGLLEFLSLISFIENDVVRYVFRGSGALSSVLAKVIKVRNNILLENPYPRTDQNQILAACDIALVILGPQMFGLGVPSKTYNMMAAGKPILFIGPKNSEIYRLVRDNDIGWAFDWGEEEKIISLIESFSTEQLPLFAKMGEEAKLLAEKSYSEAVQLDKFRKLFHTL